MTDWQDKFDEQFSDIVISNKDGGFNAAPYVKSFIESLLKEVIEEIPNNSDELHLGETKQQLRLKYGVHIPDSK